MKSWQWIWFNRNGSTQHLRVNAVRRTLAGADGEEIVHSDHAHLRARADGRAAEMRGEHDVLKFAKSGFELRLVFEDVQSRSRNAFGLQCPHQRRFVNHCTARR